MTNKTESQLSDISDELKQEFHGDVNDAIRDVMADMSNKCSKLDQVDRIACSCEAMLDLLYSEMCRLIAPMPEDMRAKVMADLVSTTDERCTWFLKEFAYRMHNDQA